MYEETDDSVRTNSKVVGTAVYKNIVEFNEIEIRTSVGKSGQTNHEAKSRRCRQFTMTKQLH